MNLIDKINAKQIKPNTPEFRVGDIVRVDLWIKEGKKERLISFFNFKFFNHFIKEAKFSSSNHSFFNNCNYIN